MKSHRRRRYGYTQKTMVYLPRLPTSQLLIVHWNDDGLLSYRLLLEHKGFSLTLNYCQYRQYQVLQVLMTYCIRCIILHFIHIRHKTYHIKELKVNVWTVPVWTH